jgi:acyl-CoA reductase-like NAD-dependent aldehyde dehydrogenase
VAQAVEEARRAFEEFQFASRHKRSQWLSNAADLIESDVDALSKMMVEMIGKPVKAARFEVGRSAAFVRSCARHILEAGGETVPVDAAPAGEDKVGIVERVPRGVIAGVTPFNAPANLLVQKVAPALATGNAIIIKPAPEGAAVALRIAEAFERAGLPSGLFQVVLGGAAEALALAGSDGVDMVTLTGGVAAGEALAQAAGIRPFVGELGGNSPNIICEDADIADAARRIAPSAFEASGQQCISTQRIIIDASVYEEFRAQFLTQVAKMKVGDPSLSDTDVGPVVHLRAAERICGMIDAAVSDGAHLLTTPDRDGCLIHPTVIEAVPGTSRVVQEEIFGPVAVLISVGGVDEAIRVANDCEFGLQASCFTSNMNTAFRMGRELRVGSVWINEASRFRLDNYPFGGFGKSGSGREGVKYAMEEMTTLKFLGLRFADPADDV